jgi:hypothetical protein
MSFDLASRIIIRFFRKVQIWKRLQIFRNLPGLVLCRDYERNKATGAMEILSVHLIYNHIDFKAMHLKFTIFDYVTKKLNYSEKYDKIESIHMYNAYHLREMLIPSVKSIPFERSPFTIHIGTIQSVIKRSLPSVEFEDFDFSDESLSDKENSWSDSDDSTDIRTPEPEIKYNPKEPIKGHEVEVQVNIQPEINEIKPNEPEEVVADVKTTL